MEGRNSDIARRITPATIYIRAKADVDTEVSMNNSNSKFHSVNSAGLEVIGLLSSGATSTLAESLPAPTYVSPCICFPDTFGNKDLPPSTTPPGHIPGSCEVDPLTNLPLNISVPKEVVRVMPSKVFPVNSNANGPSAKGKAASTSEKVNNNVGNRMSFHRSAVLKRNYASEVPMLSKHLRPDHGGHFPDPDQAAQVHNHRPLHHVGQEFSNKRKRSCSSSPSLRRSGKRKCTKGTCAHLSTVDLARAGYEDATCNSRNPGPLDVVLASGRYRAIAEYNPDILNDLSEALGLGTFSTSEAGIPHPHMGLEEPQHAHVSLAIGSNRSDLQHNVT